MTKKNFSLAIAIGFFVIWLAILYAGADHPPPPGFILIIFFDLVCSVLVYFRVNTYVNWIKAHKKKRFRQALLDGLSVGLVIAFITMLFPKQPEPGFPSPGLLENIIWFLVMGTMGAVNAIIVYGVTVFFSRRTEH